MIVLASYAIGAVVILLTFAIGLYIEKKHLNFAPAVPIAVVQMVWFLIGMGVMIYAYTVLGLR